MTAAPSWAVPALAAALSAVLSSGLTAAFLRVRSPETVAIRPPVELTVEQRALVELLVDPGPRYVSASVGAVVPVTDTLRSLGYVRGWTRTFDAGRQRLEAFVLEFGSETGAAGYARGIGGATRLMASPRPFTVGVPGASGVADTVKASDGRYLQLVALHRGTRAALLVFRDESATPGGDLLALAQRQYDALG